MTNYPLSGEVVRGPGNIEGVVLDTKLYRHGAWCAVKFDNHPSVVFMPDSILTLIIEED